MSRRSAQPTILRARRPLGALAALLALLGVAFATGIARPEGAHGAGDFNVVFILTDDQTNYELAAMPTVREEIAAKGATFKRAYVPYPTCCPSRASLLSGLNMHNHGVRGNGGEFGGWDRFDEEEPHALPPRLQAAGYYTVHIGKYLNGYMTDLPPVPYTPAGWDEWYAKVSQANIYYDYDLVEDPSGSGGIPGVYVSHGDAPTDYQTDVLAQKAVGFINGVSPVKTPFLLDFWVNAPHAPFTPAPRHLGDFDGVPLPKLAGFNERDIRDKPRWLRKQATRIGIGNRRKIIQERRRRLEQLQAVDEAVGEIIDALDAKGILDETYLIVASDNGFFRGEHRIVGGKYLAYEPSSHVPLLIRGPGIPAGVKSRELVSSLDVTQTILRIAEGSADPSLDGRSLMPFARKPKRTTTRPILLEADTGPGRGGNGDTAGAAAVRASIAGFKGVRNLDGEPGVAASVKAATLNGNFAPAYRGLRTRRYLYVLYSNGQAELYDNRLDPGQLNNVVKNRRYRPVRRKLFRRMRALIHCAGASCRREFGPEPKPLPEPVPKRKPRQRRG
jgi:N-acetylglucosamine-6-sulfatase